MKRDHCGEVYSRGHMYTVLVYLNASVKVKVTREHMPFELATMKLSGPTLT